MTSSAMTNCVRMHFVPSLAPCVNIPAHIRSSHTQCRAAEPYVVSAPEDPDSEIVFNAAGGNVQ